MKNEQMIECPQVRYHITYDENLSLKDLEELINLIRVSNNDVLQGMGVSRSKGNDLQRVERIQPGSIDIVTILSVVSSVITIGEFVFKVGKLIKNKADDERNKELEGTKYDKKVYYRNELTVENIAQVNIVDNSYVLNIHIHNIEEIRNIIEQLTISVD